MKLFYIFLDIDGVLNNMNYWNKCFKRHHIKGIMSMHCFPFDPKCLNNLMKLNQELKNQNYNVKIVLSSTWRLNQIDTEIVNSRLAEYGMRIFAKTISLSSGNRGLEIKNFLDNEKYEKAENFLIIDDEIKDIQEQFEEKYIIHTDFNTGFDSKKLQQAINKLKEVQKNEMY